MKREIPTRSRVATWGAAFVVINLMLLIAQGYWIWRYGTNHYLCIAALSNDLQMAELALKLGASANYRLPSGATPLALASHPLMAKVLLSAGADPNVRDSTGATPLFTAVERGHTAIAKILIEHGADVNQPTDSGVTALMIASRDGRLDLVQLLLSHGADATLRDQRGFTAVDFVRGKQGVTYREIERLLQTAATTRRRALSQLQGQ